jgi:hypothetical protein
MRKLAHGVERSSLLLVTNELYRSDYMHCNLKVLFGYFIKMKHNLSTIVSMREIQLLKTANQVTRS